YQDKTEAGTKLFSFHKNLHKHIILFLPAGVFFGNFVSIPRWRGKVKKMLGMYLVGNADL
uniref:hypothetical protein n=1 Tax=Mediterraneibacter gnavus TaxID=33038 RepID=UPI00402804C8